MHMDDKQLLTSLFQEIHTIFFQLVKLETEPTSAKSKSPSKTAAPKTATAKNATAAQKTATAKKTAATQKTTPAKKGKGNK